MGVEATQLLDVPHVLRVQELGSQKGSVGCLRAPLLLERERLAKVLLRLHVAGDHLQVVGAQIAGGLAQDRDDARVGRERRDLGGRGRRANVLGRGVADSLPRSRVGEQRQVALERLRPVGRFAVECGAQLGREEARLLVLGQEHLRVVAQHVVERRRAALLVADHEEVRHSRPRLGRSPRARRRARTSGPCGRVHGRRVPVLAFEAHTARV